jgi:hypothetical protein
MKPVIKRNDKKDILPYPKREAPLVIRLLPIVIGGLDRGMDKESQLYLRLLARLCDKSFKEYFNAKGYIEREISSGDKLSYRFEIINSLENCLNAINRVAKIFEILQEGKWNKEMKSIIKYKYDIIDIMDTDKLEDIKNTSIRDVRNRIEHMNEDIYTKKISGRMFIDVEDDYKQISINNNFVTIVELVLVIESYDALIRSIFDKLPSQIN